ncbi:MAG: GAF domain-containing protein [Acidobacteriota bacterium]|nr:GAF domain-containing protein [Acidobacteriota bacterium]
MMNFEDFAEGEPERLLEAALGLTKQLDIEQVLQEFVDQACTLTGALCGAIMVLDAWGETIMFVQHGFSSEGAQAMAAPPVVRDLVGSIPPIGPLIMNDLDKDPFYIDTVSEKVALENFLGVPIRVNGQLFGRLYLTDKPGGFSDSDVQLVGFLGDAAGVAVENARLYKEANNRERWMEATHNITTALLEGTEEEEALALIAQTARQVADADTALIILPSVGDTWACEIAEGYAADELLGTVFPPEGRAMAVRREGAGMIVDSFVRAPVVRIPAMKKFGPALYAPLMSGKVAEGVLVLLRKPERLEFEPGDLPLAEGLATQAAFALTLAEARHTEDINALLDERDRIGRDLHDFVIQQLFATGIHLDTAKAKLEDKEIGVDEIKRLLDTAIDAVDRSVGQIRAIVHDLREPDSNVNIVERVRRETSLARNALGFAPSLIAEIDGTTVGQDDFESLLEITDRWDPVITDDITAVIRESLSNVARHAKATAVQIELKYNDEGDHQTVTVVVEDDGVGIPKDRKRTSGLGNMLTRAERHGGTMTLDEGQGGHGTRLTWTVPVS